MNDSNKIFKVNENFLFTPDHYFLTERGLKKTQELKNGDKIIGICGKSFTEINCIEIINKDE